MDSILDDESLKVLTENGRSLMGGLQAAGAEARMNAEPEGFLQGTCKVAGRVEETS